MSTQDARVTAVELTRALDTMSERLREVQQDSEARDQALRTYGRRNRFIASFAVVSTVIDIVLTIVAVVAITVAVHAENGATAAAGRAASNQAKISAEHDSLVTACQSGNVTRAQQERALDAILAPAPPRPGESRQERKVSRKFLMLARADVARGWAPRDCARLYATPGPHK